MANHRKKPTKITTALIAISALLATGLTSQSASAATSAGPSSSRIVVSPSSTNKLNDVLLTADDIVISGFGTSPNTDMVRVELTETGGGGLRFSSTTGLTAVTGGNPVNTTTTYDSLEFTASVTDANAALANVQYYAGSSFEVATVDVFVSFAGTSTDLYSFNKTNEHFYKFVSTTETWTAAKAAAAAATFNGMQGYLATSTSSSEDSFIRSRVGTAQAWLGGQHDFTTPLVWKWQTGPEMGKSFWNQTGAGTGNTTGTDFTYTNWSSNEPNNHMNGENTLQMTAGSTGKWNDLPATSTLGYVIEFGGMAGDSIQKASTARTITVDVNYPEVKASTGNCVQNISDVTGVSVSDPNGDGSKCLITFTSTTISPNWKAPTGVSKIDLLVVGGGGAGGTYGGGGAGEFIELFNQTVTSGSNYSVSVGAGGFTSNTSSAGNRGSSSSFDSVISGGGGGGGTLTGPRASIAATAGIDGASSGGSVAGNSDSSGVTGISAADDSDSSSFGNDGGSGYRWGPSNNDYAYAAGGGGGAGGVGGNGSLSGTVVVGGNGGIGKVSQITGGSYAGGGNGGANKAQTSAYTSATRGTASHGGGANSAGTANTGGGGGSSSSTGIAGYAGGSGVVVVSYSGTGNPAITSHPANATKMPSETATFTVAATSPDSGTLSYKWQLLTTALTATWTDIAGATSATYTTGTLSLTNNGYQYRAVVTNTIGSSAKSVNSNAATLSVNNARQVNVNFTELNFDHTTANTNYVNLKRLGTSTSGNLISSGNTITSTVTVNGKTVGDRVLFKNVTTRNNVIVDAVVTTLKTNGATITTYEDGAKAGGLNSYFQSDASINIDNGYVEYQFEFYERSSTLVDSCNTSVTCGSEVEVTLLNVNVSAIDIDSDQWNDLTALNSFTVSSPTNLKYCQFATGNLLTTCTTNSAPSSYPGNVRFQGPSDNGTNRPQDMSISNYGSVTTFNVKFGRKTSSTTNYYGVAFKALSWGSATPATIGDAAAQFDIVYSGNGSTSGSVPSTQTGAVGTQYIVSSNSSPLAKTGYTFTGWNTASNGTGEAYASGATILVPNGGVTLYAVWTPSQYTLTYDAATNGGSGAPASSVHNAGASVTLSSQAPTKSGFVFSGWDTQANGLGTDFAAGGAMTMPGNNRTLYAQFSAATGTITYNGSSETSGSVPSNDVGTSGTSATVSTNSGTLAKTGYSFAGWFTNISSVVTDYAVGASINYPADGQTVTLYAKWIAIPYTLAYNSNGGSVAPSSVSKLAGAQFALPSSGSSPTRSGYNFAGWYTTQSGSGGTNYLAGATYTMPAANTTLYANWTAIDYNVTYGANAPVGTSATGSQSDSTNYTLAQVVTVKSKNTLDVSGYRFTGWNTAANGSGTDYVEGNTFNMPLGGITLFAQWVSTSVKLTYNGNGGNNVPPIETRTAGTNITLPPSSPVRTGYQFDGWCADLSSCATPLQPAGSYTVPNSDTILYAKWTAIAYTFTYDAMGGSSGPATVTGLNVGGFVTVSSTVPNKTGYSFLGWNSNMAGTGTDYVAGTQYLMGASNATIYAKWQGNPFTLTYNTNGGTTTQTPTSEGRTAGSTENVSSTLPTRTGYTFTGWNTSLNGTGAGYSAGTALTMPGANLTLYAQWAASTNAVSYNANGGSGAPASASAAFGSSVTVSSAVPTRTGFTFVGWNEASGGGSTSYASGDTFSMPAQSITLYAQWAAVNYLLSYDANGGTGQPLTQSIAYDPSSTNNAAVSATVPTRSGYDFLGWNTAANGGGTVRASSSTFAMPAANVTLYAQWSLATFTVYYNANGGTGSLSPQPGRYNTTITLTNTVPTRIGYTFVRWNVASDGTGSAFNSGATFTIPSNNTTMYAQWTATPYTITYVANGGDSASLPAAVTGRNVGETVTLSTTVPTRTNWYFTGWNTAADGSGQTYAPNTAFGMPAADVNLYARWIQNTYHVSYNANGGSGAPGSQSTSGGSITVSATTPTRPGFTFLRWDTQADDGGTNVSPNSSYSPTGHQVLYAIWDADSITVSYNVNGGSGTTPADQTGYYGRTIDLAGSGGFTNGTLIFQSWNTQANGSGTNYGADELNFALPSANITLYAIWSAPYFAVEFEPNGGTNAPSDQYAAPAQTVVIPSTAPVLAEHDFTAWTDVSTGNTYSAGSSITMPNSNVTLVANYVRRSSVGNGGGAITTPPVVTPPTGVITYPKKLNLTVYFKGDRSYLTSEAKLALKKLAATAKKYGYATSITIYGRVKETNDKSYDAKLSKARATNVAAYIKKLGVSGIFKIIAAGISPENKPVSRRVDMELFWKKR